MGWQGDQGRQDDRVTGNRSPATSAPATPRPRPTPDSSTPRLLDSPGRRVARRQRWLRCSRRHSRRDACASRAGSSSGWSVPAAPARPRCSRRCLAGCRASRASVLVDGVPVTPGSLPRASATCPRSKRSTGPSRSRSRDVVMMGRVRRMGSLPWPSRADRRAAEAILERLGLAGLGRRHIRDLSGGQQQRVFLARALIGQPDLLILDEPTASVDVKTRDDILHLLADLNRQGVTVVLTTHELNAVAAHLPWVVCVNGGVVAQGSPLDCLHRADPLAHLRHRDAGRARRGDRRTAGRRGGAARTVRRATLSPRAPARRGNPARARQTRV